MAMSRVIMLLVCVYTFVSPAEGLDVRWFMSESSLMTLKRYRQFGQQTCLKSVCSLLSDFLSVLGGVRLLGDRLTLGLGSVRSLRAGTGGGLLAKAGLLLLPLLYVSIIKNYSRVSSRK